MIIHDVKTLFELGKTCITSEVLMTLLVFVVCCWPLLRIASSMGYLIKSNDTLVIEWNVTPPFVKYFKQQRTEEKFSSNTTSFLFGNECIQFNVATYYHDSIKRYIFVLESTVFTQWILRISTNVTLSIDELDFKEEYNYMIFDHRDPNNPNLNFRSKWVSFPTKMELLYDKLDIFTQNHLSIKCEIKLNAIDVEDTKSIYYLQAIPYHFKLPVRYTKGIRSPEFHVSMDVYNDTENENEEEFSMDNFKHAFNVVMKGVNFVISCNPSQDRFELHLNAFISNENITKVYTKYSFYIPQFHFLQRWSTFNITTQESSGEIDRAGGMNKNIPRILTKRYKKIAKSNTNFMIECRIVVSGIQYKDGYTSSNYKIYSVNEAIEADTRKNEL